MINQAHLVVSPKQAKFFRLNFHKFSRIVVKLLCSFLNSPLKTGTISFFVKNEIYFNQNQHFLRQIRIGHQLFQVVYDPRCQIRQ